MTLRSLVFLIVTTGATVCAQGGRTVPETLRLKGDPAQDMDLGALRPVPLPKRSGDGPVIDAPYLCLTARRTRAQQLPESSPIRVPETLLGRPRAAIEPWLERVGGRRPEILVTRHAVLVSLLDKGKETPTPEEAMRLRRFFPALGSSITRLDAQERAHLWAIRLLSLEAALGDLLDLDRDGNLEQGDESRPLPHNRYEIYLFPKHEQHSLFVEFIMGADARPLAGKVLSDGLAPVPVSALVLNEGEGNHGLRRFLFSATLQSLRRHRRAKGGAPSWINVGLAHFMERRLRKVTGRDLAGTLPSTDEAPRNWDRFIADLVLAGKSGALPALTLTPERGLSLKSRVQSWSLVKFLVGVDRRRFAKLYGILVRTPEGEVGPKTLLDGLRETYDADLRGLETAWQQWILQGKKR